MAKETPQERNARMQAAFNKAQTVPRGGGSLADWSRGQSAKSAVLDLLTPMAKGALVSSGMKVNVTEPGEKPGYNAFYNRLDIPKDASADYIRHELLHAAITKMPAALPGVSMASKAAHSKIGQVIGHPGLLGVKSEKWMELTESPAITMGGAEAYPGFTPTGKPEDFSNIFDVSHPSWQYPADRKASALLQESIGGNPKAASLYSKALPFFQKCFRFFEE